MYWFKRLGMFAAMFALALVMSSKAEASLLTINDGTDVWTLDVATGCTTCAVTLKVVYGVASARAGLFLDAVQWDLTNPNVNPTTIGFNGTTAGTTGNWTFIEANLNANQCGGGNANAVCGSWSGGNAAQLAAGGFGGIVAGSTLTWTFNSTFASALTSLNTGNIRAAYNTANGQNAGIFSPDGGNFTSTNTSTNTSTSTNVPEPSALLLLGVGLIAARRFIKR